jgi:aspartyl-tRNA(Asn)/glutamyl-tRNA(Gln) amidotransferase subunit A
LELVESHFNLITELEPYHKAWVTVDFEGARKMASELTKEAERGEIRGPLHGIPVGIKDIYNTKGMATTMGTPRFKDNIPAEDSEIVSTLRKAGAIILGKTETTEFACLDPAPIRNPWNLKHTPGG